MCNSSSKAEKAQETAADQAMNTAKVKVTCQALVSSRTPQVVTLVRHRLKPKKHNKADKKAS